VPRHRERRGRPLLACRFHQPLCPIIAPRREVENVSSPRGKLQERNTSEQNTRSVFSRACPTRALLAPPRVGMRARARAPALPREATTAQAFALKWVDTAFNAAFCIGVRWPATHTRSAKLKNRQKAGKNGAKNTTRNTTGCNRLCASARAPEPGRAQVSARSRPRRWRLRGRGDVGAHGGGAKVKFLDVTPAVGRRDLHYRVEGEVDVWELLRQVGVREPGEVGQEAAAHSLRVTGRADA